MSKNNDWHSCSCHTRCDHSSFGERGEVVKGIGLWSHMDLGPALASPCTAAGTWDSLQAISPAVTGDKYTYLVKLGRGLSAQSSLCTWYIAHCLLDVISD